MKGVEKNVKESGRDLFKDNIGAFA